MVSSAILGAAGGTGLALVVAMTLVIWRYHQKNRKDMGDLERFDTPHSSLRKQWQQAKRVGQWDSRGSTKSCPPVYTFPTQEFNVDQEQRIIQPLQPSFTSLPEVRGKAAAYPPHDIRHSHDMLTHQSRSLPAGPSVPGARLNRTPSIASQAQIENAVRKGHRGSSPAIRTFTPDGVASGVSPPDSPPLTYMGSRSPSPLHVRTVSLESKDGKTSTYSQSSLNSVTDTPLLSIRRHSRCLSPLLIPPKSPTLSESSSQSPGPLSPLLGSLQVDLYQKKDLSLFLTAPEGGGGLGRVHLRLKYDLDKSDLHVHVIEAHELTGSDKGGFNDPYIRLTLTPQVDARKRQTRIHRNDPNPFFDEQFKFPVSQDDLKDKTLLLQVFDYDRYSRNDVVGEVTIRLEDFNVTTNLEVWAEITKNKQPSGERQEILVSLSYLPSAERLTVVLLKARNLYSPPNKDTIDPYVKVYLVVNGRRLKKKKTSARKNTKTPVWNEAVSFSLPPAALPNSAVEISVADQSNDLMGSSAAVGSSVIGPRETGVELSHWQEMSQNFRKSIAQWHVLT